MTVLEPQGVVRTRTGTTPSSGGLITATASTMGVDVGHKRVRAVGGGHSVRHAERHEAASWRAPQGRFAGPHRFWSKCPRMLRGRFWLQS